MRRRSFIGASKLWASPALWVNSVSHWRKAAFKVLRSPHAMARTRSIKSSLALKVMFLTRFQGTRFSCSREPVNFQFPHPEIACDGEMAAAERKHDVAAAAHSS